MAEMFESFVFIFIIFSQIKIIQSLFVSVGDYSNESIPGLNSPECGLSAKPIVIELSLNNPCFKRKYVDKTLVFFDKPKVKPQVNNRIFKGVDVKDVSESPWTVHLSHYKFHSSCTGVLITPHWVLTAAHCFETIRPVYGRSVILRMGSTKKEGPHISYVDSDFFYAHPLYENPTGETEGDRKRTQFHNDIALIRVDNGFIPDTTPDSKYFINTICLPKRNQTHVRSENAIFYGYGIVNDRKLTPEYLQRGWVKLNPYKVCTPMLCSSYTDDIPRSCSGDSGGPLVQFVPGVKIRATLIGIARGISPVGATCSNQIKTSFWVPVSEHIDWILKTMKENFL